MRSRAVIMGMWAKWAGISALIAIAVYVRADALGDPNYWYDEAITSLRVAGHTEQQVAAYATAHPAFAMGELEQFVTVGPSTGFGDTIHSLATEDAQHPPLYYVIARAWALLMGSSVEASRGLAALASILALAAMYWLCLELFVLSGAFATRLVCWLGVAVMALSPYQVAIAREHREYSLWSLLFAIACGAFLRALRRQDAPGWALFALAITASIYTHLFSVLGLGACAVFLLIRERFRLNRLVLSFIAAAASCGVACVPWMLVVLARESTAKSSLGWVQGLSHGRLQLGFSLDPVLRLADLSGWDMINLIQRLPVYRYTHWIFELMPIFLLAAIWRDSRRRCAGFATALICSVSLTLFVMDYFTGSASGWIYRYGIPSSLGWLLALAMVLALAVEASSKWKAPARCAVGAFLLMAGISAYLTHAQRHTWAKAFDDQWEVAEYLNANGKASLISDDFVGGILALRPQTRPDLPVSWRPRCFSCNRVLEPLLDIPDMPATGGKVLYFRSWVNVPITPLQPLVESMVEDRLDDPRFQMHLIAFTEPSISLFLLTPR